MRVAVTSVVGLLLLSCGKASTVDAGPPVSSAVAVPAAAASPRSMPVAASPTYILPSEITLDFAAERGPGGEILLTGSTNLPDGTKVGAEVPLGKGQDYDIFVVGGRFKSEGFSDKGRPLPAGPHKVQVLTYFNEAWQKPETLRIVGKGGGNLKGKLIKLAEPDVVDSDRMIAAVRTIQFPPVALDTAAIDLVKNASLSVDGKRSTTNVDGTVAYYMKSPGVRPAAGWTAAVDSGAKYTVTYSYINGELGEDRAIWSVDTATKKVAYVNKNAKTFSWLPDY